MQKTDNIIETHVLDKNFFVIKSSAVNYEYIETPVKVSAEKLKRDIAPWGADNNIPDLLILSVGKNPVASACLPFNIDLSYGSGLKIGSMSSGKFVEFDLIARRSRKELEQVYQFIEDNDINNQLLENISDLHWFNQAFVELILDKNEPGKRKIVQYTAKESTYSRFEVQNPDTGEIERHAYSAKWASSPKAEEINVTPVLSYKSPLFDLLRKLGRRPTLEGTIKTENEYRYILPIRIPTPGKLYYPKPYWVSAVDSGWMDFANAIPEYKKAYMLNSMSIKYIIEISETYFSRIFNDEGIQTKEAQQERKRKEIENINSFLKGTTAAGKSMITYKRRIANMEEEIPEVKIAVLNTHLGGEYIEDSHEASALIYTAFRVHPSLIGVIPGKTTSNLSGSDKRELLRIQQTMQKKIRDAILKPLYVVKTINKWPEDVVFAISDIILTTLDTNNEVSSITVV